MKKATKALETAPPASKRFTTALDFAMAAINGDVEADLDSKVRLAIAAMPFQHAKLESAAPGKKQQRQESAEKSAAGRFAPPAPPKLVVNNKQ
ncbi:hypothetical protein [Roseomonas xinghualingensis]|uniref:hypothetical protein n=1 Tax=Roseomonas xinghualingensis TaxID=2986475 RepID=UPI0021F16E67|nr:hypothetical protein [Roseomonas sp. SXEYE001]